jgi:hypothetical protein
MGNEVDDGHGERVSPVATRHGGFSLMNSASGWLRPCSAGENESRLTNMGWPVRDYGEGVAADAAVGHGPVIANFWMRLLP